MKKLFFMCVFSFVFIFTSQISTAARLERVSEQEDIDAVLELLYNRQMTVNTGVDVADSENAKFISEHEKAFAKWSMNSDLKVMNQYRRGVFFFLKGIGSGKDEHFSKAIPYLKIAKRKKVKVQYIMPVDEMIEVCGYGKEKRNEVIERLRAQHNNSFMSILVSGD